MFQVLYPRINEGRCGGGAILLYDGVSGRSEEEPRGLFIHALLIALFVIMTTPRKKSASSGGLAGPLPLGL